MPSYVYFIASGTNPIKIGISDNPKQRLASLQTAHYKPLQLLFSITCNSRQGAEELETAFHCWYSQKRLLNEWFDISIEEIQQDVILLLSISKHVEGVQYHVDQGEIQHMIEATIYDREISRRVNLQSIAQRVRENGDESLSTLDMMEKYGVSMGSTSKIREMLNGNGVHHE